MRTIEIKQDWIYLVVILFFIMLGIIIFLAESFRVTNVNLNIKTQTLEMYYIEQYEMDYLSYGAMAMAYCDKNILLIDILNRDYLEALEIFNHEWLHCQVPDHFKDRVIIGGKE